MYSGQLALVFLLVTRGCNVKLQPMSPKLKECSVSLETTEVLGLTEGDILGHRGTLIQDQIAPWPGARILFSLCRWSCRSPFCCGTCCATRKTRDPVLLRTVR
eukprot:s1060_g14.t1